MSVSILACTLSQYHSSKIVLDCCFLNWRIGDCFIFTSLLWIPRSPFQFAVSWKEQHQNRCSVHINTLEIMAAFRVLNAMTRTSSDSKCRTPGSRRSQQMMSFNDKKHCSGKSSRTRIENWTNKGNQEQEANRGPSQNINQQKSRTDRGQRTGDNRMWTGRSDKHKRKDEITQRQGLRWRQTWK